MRNALPAMLITIASLAYVAPTMAASTANPTRLFDWAERTYPQYFPVHVQSATAVYGGDTFIFRFYPQTGNYLGLNLSHCGVWVLGKLTDGDLLFINYFTNFTGLYDGLCSN